MAFEMMGASAIVPVERVVVLKERVVVAVRTIALAILKVVGIVVVVVAAGVAVVELVVVVAAGVAVVVVVLIRTIEGLALGYTRTWKQKKQKKVRFLLRQGREDFVVRL